MIYKEERFMHITTHHILAKRRHIDAATRLRRLSHVVATSTHVVRGCKLPFPLMPSYAAPHSPCGRSTRHVPILRLSEVFAELPQASKWRKWPLRNFRKRQNGRNGLCGTSASVKMGEMAFAELPQASKWEKWPLRNFRECQNGRNGLCGTSASVKMEETALAEVPQALLYL